MRSEYYFKFKPDYLLHNYVGIWNGIDVIMNTAVLLVRTLKSNRRAIENKESIPEPISKST